MSIRLRGVAKTKAALAKAQAQVEAAAGPATKAGGEVVQREMTSRAPRRTGHLISLIGTEEDSAGGGATTKVGSDAPYDRFVQGGTRYMAANPYGEQAANAAIPGIVAAMTAIYKAAVEG